MFFINPPFGNYINLPNTTRIYGSYTLHPRNGLIMQIMKTLRYSKKYGGWVNQIGLRNKGIDYAIEHVPKEHVISVAIMKEDEISKLIEKIPNDRNIELNISCPNVKKSGGLSNIEGFLNNKRKWCIIKLSPMTTEKEIDEYYKKGFRQFHCCNTIPVKEGGLSGKSLIPYTEKKSRIHQK
jgi:dihydroorotate dehydrogenase